MRRFLAALTLTAALALVSPIAAKAIVCEGEQCQYTPPTGTVTITKQINAHNGDFGPLSPADFPLYVGETRVTSGVPTTMAPGYYHVTETDQPNYTFIGYSGQCGGDSSGNVAVTQYGFSSCTVINEYTPPPDGTVTVHKIVVNSASGTATVEDFRFYIGESQVRLDSAISLATGTYTVTEQGPVESDQTYYASYSPSCPNGTFSVSPGVNIDCTITNSDTPPAPPTGGGGGHPKPPTMIVVVTNVTNDEGGINSPSDFIATVTSGGAAMSLTGASAGGASMAVAPGDFSVAPGTNPGYAWSTSGQCSGTLAESETAMCTIDYDDTGDTPPLAEPTPEVPPTEGSPTDDGTSTPPVDEPPTDETPAPPAPPRAPAPAPRVLGTTDIGINIPFSATTTAIDLSGTDSGQTAPPATPGASCVWFWGWFGCYWWILLLLIVLALIWKMWQKMNNKHTNK